MCKWWYSAERWELCVFEGGVHLRVGHLYCRDLERYYTDMCGERMPFQCAVLAAVGIWNPLRRSLAFWEARSADERKRNRASRAEVMSS